MSKAQEPWRKGKVTQRVQAGLWHNTSVSHRDIMPAPLCLGSASPDLRPPSELTQTLLNAGPAFSSFIDSFLELPIHHCLGPSLMAHSCDSSVGPVLHSFITGQLGGCLFGICQASCLQGEFSSWPFWGLEEGVILPPLWGV